MAVQISSTLAAGPTIVALVANVAMGLLWAGAFLAYAQAFNGTGAPALSVAYLWRLASNPWFIAALALSLAVSVLRMWLFAAVGEQRTYFVQSLSSVIAAVVVVLVLRERMPPAQWAGAGLVTAGIVLLGRT